MRWFSLERQPHYEAYRAEVDRERVVASGRTAVLFVVFLNSSFLPLDMWAHPDRIAVFVSLRLAWNACMLAVYWALPRFNPSMVMRAACLVIGGALISLIGAAGGVSSNYWPGLMILFVGIPVFMPFSAREAFWIVSVLSATFASLPLATGEEVTIGSYLVPMFFVFSTAAEAVVSSGMLDRLRFADFKQRQELEAARDELKELDRAKSRFTANVHHELRTPLTLVLASVDSILDPGSGLGERAKREYLESARVNGLRLLKLINNLLDLAKLEGQQLKILRRPVDVGQIGRDLVLGARPLAEKKGVSLSTHGLDGLPVVNADPEAVEKVILNLLGNALKFTDSGGRIELRGAATADGIELMVTDTGAGIPADQLERIFDRFAQVDASATRKHEGTGIGLALAKELVELHDGRIWAESDGADLGSTFRVTLPAGEVDPNVEEAVLQTSDGRELALERSLVGIEAELDLEQRTEDYQLSGLSNHVERTASAAAGAEVDAEGAVAAPPADAPEVLVVEDNAAMRRLLRNILMREFRVRTAANGREGLEAVRASKPSVVLTDIMMPEMSGTELCQALKSDPETRDIPVVLVTSKGEREMKLEGLELGAQDYVTKPFHPRELLARVRSFAGLRALHEELADRNRRLEATMRELQETEVQLVQSERLAAVGELAAGIAHEVNNPVNFAVNSLHALRSRVEDLCTLVGALGKLDPDDPASLGENLSDFKRLKQDLRFDDVASELEELAAIVTEGLDRTHRLVGDLRDFAGHRGGPDASIDVREGIAATLRLMHHALQSAEVGVELDFEPELPTVRASAAGLNQVFLNLLKNSTDVLEGSGGTLRVAARRDGSDVLVEIADDGPGIDPAIRARLFEPFVSSKAAGKGTGLGLSVSRRIVNALGGSLEVSDREPHGAVFTLRLPAEGGDAT